MEHESYVGNFVVKVITVLACAWLVWPSDQPGKAEQRQLEQIQANAVARQAQADCLFSASADINTCLSKRG